MKKLAIFGSTGSIGVNALDVVRHNADRFRIACLSAQENAEALVRQAIEFRPDCVCIGNAIHEPKVKKALGVHGIDVLCGPQGLVEAARRTDYDMMVGAIVGYAGLFPTIEAIKAGKDIALANKETLVVGGGLVTELVKKHGVSLIPIDSEHSALFQCMVGEQATAIRRIILTASGGPFLSKAREEFEHITPEQALKHPNWSMGSKITIDSATLMNKGLEVIEAHWLFGVEPHRIEVAIHPQSIIHSMVEFVDGSTKAQMGVPDMKVPIQYALSYPDRIANGFDAFDFRKFNRLDFAEPDRNRFPCLALAYDALREGRTMPAVLNAANEVAVAKFLEGDIRFTDIPKIISYAMDNHDNSEQLSVQSIVAADSWSRNILSTYKLN